ncbi:hypothetical protein HHI36_020903 [Cryptolaemus montrouzieri]|uniref:THAP-type domain-containing protein n=1 Tax=Cryptolaemus montrouzieri TaxID=559131 RepID=A0ABD2NCQ8_9CUCU
MVYKWCVVPQCTNTSIKSPQKVFVSVPTNPNRRTVWLQLARRDPKSILSHTNVFMCEDHFDMENDTINYMKYKMGFSQKILLADEALPTKFHCQDDRLKRLSDSEPTCLKRQRIHSAMDYRQRQNVSETYVESLHKTDIIKQEIIVPEDVTPNFDSHNIEHNARLTERNIGDIKEEFVEVKIELDNEQCTSENELLTEEEGYNLGEYVRTIFNSFKNSTTRTLFKKKLHELIFEMLEVDETNNQI